MPPERWRRIDDLFHAALACEPAVRRSFLDEACGGDGDLLHQVQSLLDQDAKSGRLVSEPLERVAAEVMDPGASAARFSGGSMVGPYRILELVGAGGMGQVYRARDTRLDRTVAIKFLQARFNERFEREARAISALNHPHICTLYDVGSQGGVGYLVMEFVEGEMLVSPQSPRPIPMEQALRLGVQIADALAAAHARGILHRDLKPANILVAKSGGKSGVKLLDFGLAKFVHGRPNPASGTVTAFMTGPQQIVGTLQYMSPEQLEGKEIDARSDIFSFGLVLYEMLTGRRAFQAPSQAGLIAAILKDEPQSVRALQPTTLPALDRAISKCLAKEPERRWQTASDLRDELEWIATGDSVSPAPLPRRRRLLPWIGAAAAVVALAAFGSWTASRSRARIDSPLVRLNVDLGPEALVGGHVTAAISPDGTRVAFPARAPDGKRRLATRLLDERESTLLAGSDGADDPFFSPDSQWIGFFAEGKMKKVSVRGSAVVDICEAPAGRGAAWGDDGNIIATLGSGSGSGLMRVPASGGAPQVLTDPSKRDDATHRWPQILPGGNAVLFMANKSTSNYDNSDIEVLSLQTGTIKIVQRRGYFGRYLPGGYLVYVHNRTLFGVRFNLARMETSGAPTPLLDDMASDANTAGGQFDFSRDGKFTYLSGKSSTGTWTLSWLDSTGGIQSIVRAPGVYYEPRISPEGKRLAFSSGTDIETYDWERGTRARLTFAAAVVNDYPVWTPDGKHIVFVSQGANKSSLQWIRADGAGEPLVLLDGKNDMVPFSFSPDGKRLAFSEPNQTGSDLWTLPIEMSNPERPRVGSKEPFLRNPFVKRAPAFSPDGRWIAFSSKESGRSEVFVQPFPPRPSGFAKWPISTGGGWLPIWSRDGRELFYEDLDNRIMAVSYRTTGDSFVPEKPRAWSKTQLLDADNGHVNLDVARDGKRFVVTAQSDSPGDAQRSVHVTFLLNFFDELRRRIPQPK